MGIRVNKMLGYGLTDVSTTPGGRIIDPRIDPSSPLLTYACDAPLDAFLAWLDTRGDDDSRWDAASIRALAGKRVDPLDACVRTPEYGLPGVLCLRPVWMPEWHRYDDAIDWVEETYLGPDGANGDQIRHRVDVLPHGLYPFNGIYMDSRTGRRLNQTVMTWVQARSSGRADLPLLDALAAAITTLDGGEHPFTGHTDAEAHAAPLIPAEIRHLAEWGHLFTDPAVVYQLRPMRYVWWS